MPTVSRLANRGLLGVYVDLVHARQELEGLLGVTAAVVVALSVALVLIRRFARLDRA